jgi:hypothetical protein
VAAVEIAILFVMALLVSEGFGVRELRSSHVKGRSELSDGIDDVREA